MTSATAKPTAPAAGQVERGATGGGRAQGERLRLALGIYRVEPRGGLEDQCIRLAEELSVRGHDVTLFSAVPAPVMPFRCVTLAPSIAPSTNHGRMHRFAEDFAAANATGYDRTVAFQPMPGVDVLFCADMPRGGRRSLIDWVTQRHGVYASLEERCFAATSKTRIICLARPQAEAYSDLYDTPSDRLALMPPSIDINRRQPERRRNRPALRRALGIEPGQQAWLWLGLHPNTKGLDRVIDAVAEMSGARLLVAGVDRDSPRTERSVRQARAKGALRRISWLGYRAGGELLDLMAAADVLAHPARVDVTGAVILEAIVNGLPAVATENCGFSEHIVRSHAGVVVRQPFSGADFARALAETAANPALSDKGIAYGREVDVYGGLSVAADMIERPDWYGQPWLLRPQAQRVAARHDTGQA